ncbi:MAG: KH domain-containing protein [Candidatus Anstonellaceae archaeon]
MRTPICKICAWKEDLCPTCNKKFVDGGLSHLDIEISKILYRINESINISNADFSKAYDIGEIVIIESSNPGLLIGKKGKIISLLSSALQKKVRVIRENTDIKTKIADIVAPITLNGINYFWSQGKEVTKIRLKKNAGQKLYVGEETLKRIISEWLKKDVEIVYE